MFADGGEEFGGLGNQLLAFYHFVLKFFTVLEVAGVFFFSFNVVVNGFNWKVRDEEVDIGLNLVQFTLEVHGIE